MVSTEDWFQEMHLSSADTKIHRCSSPLYKMAVQSPLVSTGSAPLDSPPVDTQGWLYGFPVCNFSSSFLTCPADPLCRSWERRCLRRSTVTSREQGSREPARQRSGQLWKEWCLESVTVLRLTNYSTLRSSCWSPGQKGSLFPRTIMKQLSETSSSSGQGACENPSALSLTSVLGHGCRAAVSTFNPLSISFRE